MLKRSYKRIHCIGAGGAGVSALAHLLLHMGYEVTGSDLLESEVTESLREAGATVWIGHDERYTRKADLVVFSTAIPQDNPEIILAKDKGIPLLTRIELLSYLAAGKESVVVSGSHGKSTTTSMLATSFIYAQRDPTVVMGGVLMDGMGNARLGKSELFLCEGDESNNSILEFTPKVAVVTNIDRDHLDFHGSLTNLKNSFIRFINSPGPSGFSVVCYDDHNIRSILRDISGRVVTYGFHPDAEYQAQGRALNREGGLSFEVHHKERGPLGVVNLSYPGDHNIQNALATIATCCSLGIDIDTVTFSLENFPGVRRRYERLYQGRVHIIDDYAHHPSEIQALLSGVREVFSGRIRVVFQPHRFTRSKSLAAQFPRAFINADEVILAPIYSANESPIAGIGTDYLNRFFQRRYDNGNLLCLDDFNEITDYLCDSLMADDIILTVGAGDICNVGHALAARLRQQDRQAAGEWT